MTNAERKIIIIDDDITTLKLIELVLKNNNYSVDCFLNPKEALKSLLEKNYDAVLSDYYMPEINGEELLKEFRIKDKYTPFIILTCLGDINFAVKLMKEGADDYLVKPFSNEELIIRIEKNISNAKNRKYIETIEREKEILELESKRLADWKLLYAAKDSKQAENVIELFNRTVNESGGFGWVELLKKELKISEDGRYYLPKELVDLIIKSSERYKTLFENISYLANINNISFTLERISYVKFIDMIKNYCKENLQKIVRKYNRDLIIEEYNSLLQGEILISEEYIYKIFKELIINAIKYSPENTTIEILFQKGTQKNSQNTIDIIVKNTPREMNTRKSDLERYKNQNINVVSDIKENEDGIFLFEDDIKQEDKSKNSQKKDEKSNINENYPTSKEILKEIKQEKELSKETKLEETFLIGESCSLSQKEDNYTSIIGIPYEYSELVFDLFYTIEPFPIELEEEEWKGGTGLYIVRKIITRLGGWIRNANGYDYSKGEPSPFVSFIITLPLYKNL